MLIFQLREIFNFLREKPIGYYIPPSIIETLEHSFFKHLNSREIEIAFIFSAIQREKHRLSKQDINKQHI